MAIVDLLFPVMGSRIPSDHGYALYAAISRLLPNLHNGSLRFGMATITGPYVGNGLLQIEAAQSRLRVRLAADAIPGLLPLAGKALDVKGHRIRLGVPQILALSPTPALVARLVTIKNATEAGPFLEAARLQLNDLGIAGNLRVPEHRAPDGTPEPTRRVMRIKEVCIVGFALVVEGLTAEESLRLQEVGLGGRRHVGCGLFLPALAEESHHAA